ncbi:CHRAC1 isoform 3, partial [Pongo abelii]
FVAFLRSARPFLPFAPSPRPPHCPPALSLALSFGKPELFVQCLATYSYRHGSGKEKKVLTYSDLANTAQESETFQFLAGT